DPGRGLKALALAPDGKTVAGATQASVTATRIVLWDGLTGKEVRRLAEVAGDVTALAFSPDGRTLASGGWDQKVRLWDVAGGKETKRLAVHFCSIVGLAFSPDGKTLASCSEDRVLLWRFASDREPRRLGGWDKATSLAFSHDGQRLAVGRSEGPVRVWDVGAGRMVRELSEASRGARGGAF